MLYYICTVCVYIVLYKIKLCSLRMIEAHCRSSLLWPEQSLWAGSPTSSTASVGQEASFRQRQERRIGDPIRTSPEVRSSKTGRSSKPAGRGQAFKQGSVVLTHTVF